MNQSTTRALCILSAALALGGTTVAHAQSGGSEKGIAAVYSDKLNGHKTASGKTYNRNAMTAAHKTLPFGTHVKVTNTKNNKSTEVVINDRGPVQPDRVLDLSPAAAHKLGIGRRGMGEVTVDVVGEPAKKG